MKRPCATCGRQVNPERPGADHLFNRPDGSEVWLCGRPSCLAKYNEEDDLPGLPPEPIGQEPEDAERAR